MLRKCVGCGKLEEVSNMIKLTRDHKTGEIIKFPSSYVFGRSAYLCYNQTCIMNALKKNRLNRALKTSQELKGLFIDGEYQSK